MSFVLILIVSQFYGAAATHVPFATAAACLEARDDLRRSSIVKADCYGTGNGGPIGRIER